MPNHIPALTGLRFLAAFTVVLAHGLLATAQFHEEPWIFGQFKTLAALGMSIFFVLSGFVIHYTYRSSLRQPHGLYNFFVARFARLYPLYILLIIPELIYTIKIHPISPLGNMMGTLPYYLTLTQTWWYGIFNDASLVYQFGQIAQISWSISTEAWFYLAYPVVLLGLTRLRRPTWAALAYVAHCVVAIAILYFVATHYREICEFALRLYGEIADGRGNATAQDTFFRWIVYFSPYSRVLEFIAGCLSAQLFVTLSGRPIGPIERVVGLLLSMLALIGIVFTQILLFAPTLLPFAVSWVVYVFHMSFGFAPACGLLTFCCARYKNVITAPFSWRPVIVLGDASYSIYLLHMLFFTFFRTQPVESTALNILFRLALFCGVSVLLFAASLASYRLIEVPARRWVRGALSIHGKQAAAARRLRLRAACGLVAVALLVPITLSAREVKASYKRWASTTRAITEAPSEGTIDVISSVYGANCVNIENNATSSLRRNCNGRSSCDYVVNVAILGDPAPGCGKDFKAEWRCSEGGDVHTMSLPPEAGLRSVARLSCQPAARSSATSAP